MSNVTKRFGLGESYANGMIALAIIALIALGCTCGKTFDLGELANKANETDTTKDGPFGDSKDGMPNETLLKAIVKETTADFAYAISEGDFSKMYEKASPEFKKTYTIEQFKNSFSDFTRQRKTLLPILTRAVTSDPEYTTEPRLRTEKGQSILVIEGKYPTKPLPVTFDYEYVKRDGRWKMLILKVYIR